MNDSATITYDPTDIPLRELDRMLSDEALSIADLVKRPEAVQLLLRQQAEKLYELRASKTELMEQQRISSKLRDEREELRIEIARLKERGDTSLIEIPVSIVSGFAINMLTIDITNPQGWLLLTLSVILLFFLRRSQIGPLFRRTPSRKEEQ